MDRPAKKHGQLRAPRIPVGCAVAAKNSLQMAGQDRSRASDGTGDGGTSTYAIDEATEELPCDAT